MEKYYHYSAHHDFSKQTFIMGVLLASPKNTERLHTRHYHISFRAVIHSLVFMSCHMSYWGIKCVSMRPKPFNLEINDFLFKLVGILKSPSWFFPFPKYDISASDTLHHSWFMDTHQKPVLKYGMVYLFPSILCSIVPWWSQPIVMID